MIICPECGRSLPDSAKFCAGCGINVEACADFGEETMRRTPPIDFAVRRCVYCNAPLRPEANFCPVCGKEQEAEYVAEESEEYPAEVSLEEEPPVQESPAVVRREVYRCSNPECGIELPDGAAFCRMCGEPAIKVYVGETPDDGADAGRSGTPADDSGDGWSDTPADGGREDVGRDEEHVVGVKDPTLHGDLLGAAKEHRGSQAERNYFSEPGDLD